MPGKVELCRAETVTAGGWPVRIVPMPSARRMTLRADAKHGGFRLSVPANAKRGDALAFLCRQEGWIREAAGRTLLDWQPRFEAGERHWVLGRQVVLGRDGVPAGDAFRRWAGRETAELVRRLVPLWEQRMGVRIPCIRWRNMTSRWGSCQTVSREIHLSVRLIHVPPECIEYVLVHEMCHYHHADHSPAFHAELTALMPDWHARRETLNRFDPRPLPPEER